MLASHSEISATAEPWVLFPSICALRRDMIRAEYNEVAAQRALSEFLTHFPQGEDEYYSAVRRMALHLYDEFMRQDGTKRFLDKTSRYHLVFREIFRTFPAAKFILLVRNPLAILASFLENMVDGDWRRLCTRGIRHDLSQGLGNVRDAVTCLGENARVIRYEALVNDAAGEMKGLCKFLGLEYEDGMVNYGDRVGVLSGQFVDHKSIHRHMAPVKDYEDAWRSKYLDPQRRLFARGFLTSLGPQVTDPLGYPHAELMAQLPMLPFGLRPLVPWRWAVAERRKLRFWHKAYLWMAYCLRERQQK